MSHMFKRPAYSGRAQLLILGALAACALAPARGEAHCARTLTADVVALDQVFFWNRLGAVQPQGMMYALRRDVVPTSGSSLTPGNVQLRPDKRPRPLVLRMNVGDCLEIHFQNLLNPVPVDAEQPATRTASIHVLGLELVGSIASDGSNVGTNPSSLVPPGGTAVYTYHAEREGGHVFYSTAATTGGQGDGGSLNAGLFGALIVEPPGAEWYRSQLTAADVALATTGVTPDGHPLIDYQALYPPAHPLAGLPILNMLQGNEVVHSDLRAIITGPGAGRFPPGTFPPNATLPDREQPFREFAILYHDEIGAVQAFPDFFDDPVLSFTLHSVRDGFAMNYGTGGVGAEILANRLGVGPMHDCTECKYEEFFLASWTVGDPAEVVDVPANTTDGLGNLVPGPKATRVLYPDDPANVYSSYLGDHVKFRILHSGSKEHHIHHQHTHQWLRTPDRDDSAYLDSQVLGPGNAFTLEMAHNGSGNRNQTVGDSIFHCHFYPHFAQGMWAMWRVHDVFEAGTVLDADGRPAPGSRALPDGEIAAGVPIPAIIPLPTRPMAPLPAAQVQIVQVPGQPGGQVQVTGSGNPGFPFFVPGVAGHRPPHPPLDTVDDGGLPRHIITAGTFHEVHTRLDFSKDLLTASAFQLPESGTAVELAAMGFHAQRLHPTFTPEGTPGSFVTNGLPPQPGAAFADPCVDDSGNATGMPRLYKAAVLQLDVKLNKAGWHFPQQRILSLWGDVTDTQTGARPPEPLFMRAHSNDCITLYHTNLVPNVYEQDDFQVRTPTDILGQHIHLVKFDVLSSDGAGNGWNYEDGTFSPDEVIERIDAINAAGGLVPVGGGPPVTLVAQAHPFFGTHGAQTTVQRWFADDVLNNQGADRTLRAVFTHDHYGPSTHQQAGLYAGLIIEPVGSTWRDPETGVTFGSRFDGGPTRFRADILTANPADSYREFLFGLADFQLAYRPDGTPVNPPGRVEVGLPFLYAPPQVCPGGVPAPCPEAISADEPGTMVVNYRNEPLALRVRHPATNTQAAGDAGDLAKAYLSNVARADPALNTQPAFYPPLTGGVQPGDPFTPLLRVYEGDRVRIRMVAGAHEENHQFSLHGVKWLYEPAYVNSGFRASQVMGISEHFELELPPAFAVKGSTPFADYLYQTGASLEDQWNGMWGLLRTYNGGVGLQPDLLPLPSNPDGKVKVDNPQHFAGLCPKTAPRRRFNITAITAQQALPGGRLVYNPRTNQGGVLNDPTAILYVQSRDLDAHDRLKPGVPVEPLILRAAAGDCIDLTLENKLPATLPDLPGFSALPMIVNNFNANQVAPSTQVGLHPQLVVYDILESDGANVGFNPLQTTGPGGVIKYRWYAGDVRISQGSLVDTPAELGTLNLISADPIKHSGKGAIGALIIEPAGATWVEDPASRASATVTPPSGPAFREHVLVFQNDVNLRFGDGSPVPLLAGAEDSEDSGQQAFNYRTEPLWKRLGYAPDTPLSVTRTFDFTNVLTNNQVGGDPVTPVFTAQRNTRVRFRLLEPQGHQRNDVFHIHGHTWQDEPYTLGSTVIGSNPLSEWQGASVGHGPSNHADVVLQNGAGGFFGIPGDYLYRTYQSVHFDAGQWGLFRVTP